MMPESPPLRLPALRLATLLLLGAVLVTACAPAPDDVHWGMEECAQCQMVIGDERFAAQVVDQRGKTYKFDAIECMAAFVDGGALAAGDIHSLWVADGRDSWVDVEEAAFLYSENTRSPMGGGYTAHADGDAARRLQAEVGGELMTWQQVRDRVALTGHDHGAHHVPVGHDDHGGRTPAGGKGPVGGHGPAGGHDEHGSGEADAAEAY
jgi:copper chaperone NosL